MDSWKNNIIEAIGMICGALIVGSVTILAVAGVFKLITLMF